MSFPVASKTPTLSHTVWLNGNAISSGECLGPLHHTRMQWKIRMIRKTKGGQTWSVVNGKCSDQVDMSCKCILFIHSTVSHWLGSQSLHLLPETNQRKTLTMGFHRHRLCSVRLWKGEEQRDRERERWSEWLHQVLIYHDSKCTRSIKNYLGTEHWPLSNK